MPKPKGSPRRAALLICLAAAVGGIGGLFGFAFQSALRSLQVLGLAEGDTIVDAARHMEPALRLLVPAAGGLLAALCLRSVRWQRGPFGITDVMDLVVTRKDVIRIPRSLMQILSSFFSISTGASIGRESANSQIGATAASALGAGFGCTSRERTVLLGCGVAAGMAISYNAPIAGALFVMEVVLGNFAMDVFAPIVVSAVIATLVNQALSPFGRQALYAQGEVGVLQLSHPYVVLGAVLLGVLCAAGAIGFRRMLAAGGQAFRALRLPPMVALPLGGLLVGAIGVGVPSVWGNGQDVVLAIIEPDPRYLAVSMLISIVVLKTIATSISIGSGALGGLFTPTLVVGASLGAVYAFALGWLLPLADMDMSFTELRTGFALVGMAGLVAATTHAPITAVLLVFEFTRNYDLILPVMICSILGSLVARLLDPESIFTARMRSKAWMLAGGIEALAMQTNFVRDVMRTDAVSVRDTAAFAEVMEVFTRTRRDTVFVVDDAAMLRGRIHIHDVKFFINDPSLTRVVIAADLMHAADPVTPDQSLAAVFSLFDDPDLDELPVVQSADDARLVARLTRRDVIALLSDEVLRQRPLRAKLRSESHDETTYVQLPPGTEVARVALPEDLAGRSLSEVDLPGNARLVVLTIVEHDEYGREHRYMPEADKRLEKGSHLIVVGSHEAIEAFGKPPPAP